MAFHRLVNPNDFPGEPIAPTSKSKIPYKTPDSFKWVPASNCTAADGISIVYIEDSMTGFILYIKQFIYQGYCFFGILPSILFRPGHVSNAWFGLGLWGNYTNDWNNTIMDGDASVFSLQALDHTNKLHKVIIRS